MLLLTGETGFVRGLRSADDCRRSFGRTTLQVYGRRLVLPGAVDNRGFMLSGKRPGRSAMEVESVKVLRAAAAK